jgi:hypothetical protein
VQVSASYQSKRLVRREKSAARTLAYGPGAIDWGGGMAQAAAFVTPRDPAVDALARQAGRLALGLENNPFGNRNVAFAAAIAASNASKLATNARQIVRAPRLLPKVRIGTTREYAA